jgi:hypothetical protein
MAKKILKRTSPPAAPAVPKKAITKRPPRPLRPAEREHPTILLWSEGGVTKGLYVVCAGYSYRVRPEGDRLVVEILGDPLTTTESVVDEAVFQVEI